MIFLTHFLSNNCTNPFEILVGIVLLHTVSTVQTWTLAKNIGGKWSEHKSPWKGP